MEVLFDEFRAIEARLSNVAVSMQVGDCAVDEVKSMMRLASSVKNAADRVLAVAAAEIHQRSRRELGSAGLAKSEGHVNSQNMIAHLTGFSRAEAKKLDALGRSIMLAAPRPGPSETLDASENQPAAPTWHAAISARMLSGEITPDRFEALRTGLGEATDDHSAAELSAAAEQVLSFLHPDDLPETVYRDARAARALLDRTAVAENEKEQYNRQQAKIWRDREGMVHLSAVFAPDDGTFVKNALDLLLGPRIGGPRLADKKAIAEAHLLRDDPRTVEQLAAGALVALVKAGAGEHSAVLAKKRPAVQIVVTASELTRPGGDGIAFIEGTGIPVSMNTVDRLVCDAGYQPVVVAADGSPLDLGREHRLFQPAQRLVLNALQGGCVWPGCEKPPSFCEIHHIEHWQTGGKTDINDGVLLCKHHHLLLHSNEWRIHRATSVDDRYENRYWLTPPRSIDPAQQPRRLAFSGVLRRNPALAANSDVRRRV